MDRSTLDPEIQQAREELGRLLDELINQPLGEEARRIAGENLDQLKSDIQAQGGGLRRQIDTGFTATNDDLGDAVDKVRSAVSKIGNDVIQTAQNTQLRLEGMAPLLNSLDAGLASSEERLTRLMQAQLHHNATSFKAMTILLNTQQAEYSQDIASVSQELAGVKEMLCAEREDFQQTLQEQRFRFKTLLGLLLLTGVGTSSVLLKLFLG
jgi:CubicO group peptidase (beta-lactamase class C family)